MEFLINDKDIATRYIHELFSGSTKIAAFCKFNDCTKCVQTTKLYERVLNYHKSDLVQKLFNIIGQDYTKKITSMPLAK